MKKALIFIVMVLVFNNATAGSLFACKQANGTIKVQAAACESGQVSQVKAPPTRAETAYAREQENKAWIEKYDADNKETAKRLEDRRKKCRPVLAQSRDLIGQNISVVTQACGWADKENRTDTARGTSIQLIYETAYVYTTNDIITAVQNR